MRSIKFKYYYNVDTDGEIFSRINTIEQIEDKFQSNGIVGSHDKRCQFTGILDYNNTEIYEGDIIKLINGPEIGCVEYGISTVTADDNYCGGSGLGFYIKFNDYSEMLSSSEHGWGNNPTTTNNIEVIGNIYEHPHLLTDQ